jgi:uncharacterized membrane protein
MERAFKIETKQNAPAFHSDEIRIKAPIEKVYNTLYDISSWPKWRSDVKETIIEGSPKVDKQFEWKAGGLKIKSKLHTVKANKAYGWTGKILWISAVHNWSFEGSNGVTVVKVEESMEGFGSSLMKGSLKKTLRKDLLDLKTASERN